MKALRQTALFILAFFFSAAAYGQELPKIRSAYDEYSKKLIRNVPYPNREGIQIIIDQLDKSRPQAKNLNPSDFIDPSILKEIGESGFVKRLYGE
jgi:hypothetical protein